MPDLMRFLRRPVQLYRFERQHLAWRFAAADRPLVVAGDEYLEGRGIRRGTIVGGGNDRQSELEITMPYLVNPGALELPSTQALGDNWRPYPPGDEILVTVMEAEYGDLEATLKVVWTGHVAQPEYNDTQLKLVCAPGRAGPRKSGLIPRWCRNCWVPWGSQGRGMCNVDMEAFAADAELASAAGLTISGAAFGEFPAGRLAGGFIRWERADGLLERRDIRAHSGTSVTLNYGAHGLEPGLLVRVYPGCAHNEADCGGYFDNLANYPGVKTIPVKDLFDGNRRLP